VVYESVQSGGFQVVVVAASQGGLAASAALLRGLAAPLSVPVVLVQHRVAGSAMLAPSLTAKTGRRVTELVDGEPLVPGHLYVTPAGPITRIDARRRASVQPIQDGGRCLRPADALFVSAAEALGAGVIAVVLTGRLDDGAVGVQHVKRSGGRVLVQDPAGAEADGMPSAALATGCVDLCMPAANIGAALSALVTVPGAAELFRTRSPSWAYLPRGFAATG
jgi:two-component system chemotaxis response regulator CheB